MNGDHRATKKGQDESGKQDASAIPRNPVHSEDSPNPAAHLIAQRASRRRYLGLPVLQKVGMVMQPCGGMH
jgi:hypothetical protein